jgi:hypothetical protein
MVEKLFYTSKMAINQFAKLVADCHFPENTDDTWVLAEQIPDHVVANPKNQAERKKMLLFKLLKLKKLEKQEIHLTGYSSGRIFRENMEIRWEKQGNDMHVVYLGTEEYFPVLRDHDLQENRDLLKATRAATKFYYLFGERLKEEDLKYKDKKEQNEEEYFAEVRIPQLLLYPVKPNKPDDPNTKPYVCLKVREYINAETGIVELFRFQKLESSGGK